MGDSFKLHNMVADNKNFWPHRKTRVNRMILPMQTDFFFVRHHIMQFETIPFICVFCTNKAKPQICSSQSFISPPIPNG